MNKPTYTTEQVVEKIVDRTRALKVSSDGEIFYDASKLGAAGRMFTKAAFDAWARVSGLTFVEKKGSDAQITFYHSPPSSQGFPPERSLDAYMISRGPEGDKKADILISTAWVEAYGKNAVGVYDYNSYAFQTYIHEIGHALGLDHPGDYNAVEGSVGVTFANSAEFANDSWQMTVMSYFSQEQNPNIDAEDGYVVTPMIADIKAIQSLYGRTVKASSGDTVYGYGQKLGDYRDQISLTDSTNFALTVFDSAGSDTFNYALSNKNQTLNLGAGALSNVLGYKGNLQIAEGVTIENAYAGRGNDHVIGNEVANHLEGGCGNDRLEAKAGNDRLVDALGNNTLDGGAGHDHLVVLSGRNILDGGQGSDYLEGGSNSDILKGGQGDDVLRGSIATWSIGAADELVAGSGNDVLMGGAGRDTFVFSAQQGENKIGAFAHKDVSFLEGAGYSVSGLTRDFETGYDRVKLVGIDGITAQNVMDYVSSEGTNTVFDHAGTRITWVDVGANELSAGDFIFA